MADQRVMEEYEQKLSTGNVFIQTQAVSILHTRILKLNRDGADTEKSSEVEALYRSVRQGGSNEAAVAVSGLVALVKEGVIPGVTLLSNLLADVLTAKCPAPTVHAITQIMIFMCEKDWSAKEKVNTAASDGGKDDEKYKQSNSLGNDTNGGLPGGDKSNGIADDLVNPFTGPPSGPVSPYVTLVRKKPDLTPLVLEECGYLLFHPDNRLRSISVSAVRPLLLYAACLSENSSPAALLCPLLHLLQQAHCATHLHHTQVVTVLLQAAHLARSVSVSQVQCKVSVLCSIAAIASHDDNTALQHALLPSLVTALPLATEHGVSTRSLMRHICSLLRCVAQRGCDVTLAALALALPHVTASTLSPLLRYCGQLIMSSNSNPLVCCSLLPSVLQILSAPCSTAPALTAAASALATLMQHKKRATSDVAIKGNQYWGVLQQVFPSLPSLLNMVEVCNELVLSSHLSPRWLRTLADSPNRLGAVHQLVVTAIFLYQASPPDAVIEASKVLEREVVKTRSGALELYPMLLYRLARDRHPETRLTILHLLPSLASSKLSVTLIIKILNGLWSSAPLRPVILRVTYDLWRVDARVYSFLRKLVIDAEKKAVIGSGKNKQHDGQLSIARAFVVAAVCKDKPSQHGEELLPVLSDILNENSSRSNINYASSSSSNSSTSTVTVLVSSAVCVFALSAITELINSKVIDLRTTWKVVAPKLAKDKRPDVVIALCKMLALSPKLQVKSDEYERFTNTILSILWNWTSNQNKSVVEATYAALEEFNMASFCLKMLPSHAWQGIKLPASLAATPFEAAKKPEDVLTYVPGEAWIALVRGSKTSLWPYLELFVRSLIKREVAGLYKGIYLTAIQEAKKKGLKGSGGQPEPLAYDFLKEYSTLRATVAFLHLLPQELQRCSSKDEGDRMLNTLLIFLRALGQPLNRPYPALDWILLSKVQEATKDWCEKHAKIDWDERIRHAVFDILAKQCNKSASASAYILKYLAPTATNGLTQRDEIHLFGLMDYLGRGIPPASLQPFIQFSLNRYISETNQLKLLLDAVKPVLTSELIHDTNRNALGNIIESLNEKIDPCNNVLYTSYKSCVADLPSKHIERLTSPSLWWEVTNERLYRAAVLRCHVACNDKEEMALPWLNDIVDCAASMPGERTELLRVLAETLTVRCGDSEAAAWFLQLLGQLLDQTKKKIPDNIVANHEHNQRLLFYSDLLIISLVIWSGSYINYGVEKLVENPSVCNTLIESSITTLFERPNWQTTLPQLLNFLVSSFTYLDKFVSSRYSLAPSTILMANHCPSLSQQMWNKVVALNVVHADSVA